MAWTQTDIDKLKAAIATGAMEVRFADGRTVKYRTLGEMRETLRLIQGEATPPAEPVSRSSVAAF